MHFLPQLKRLLGTAHVHAGKQLLEKHGHDEWYAHHCPDAVVFARDTDTVRRVMRFATAHRVPVTVRGAGVGYVGGCVPIRGGIVLSLAKMNRILEIHPEDGVAVVQPGVITGDLQDAVRKIGLFYPPDPASLRECTLGGNIATNAGGPRCLKYGVTRHYVLGLEVVLPDGTVVRAGGRTHKNKTGFDLVGLFTGSEGMLGTVTQATLRLLPHPPARALLSVGFASERAAARAVQSILKSGILPSAMEVADRMTLDAARHHVHPVPEALRHDGHGHLLVELDGQRASVRIEATALARHLRRLGGKNPCMALTERGCERLWDARRAFSYSLRATGLHKLNEDVTVPRSRLVDLFDFARVLQKRHGIRTACFGHAGDGNIHVNLMIDNSSAHQRASAARGLDDLFRQIILWGGAITGEHGIGLAKKRWWPLALGLGARSLHQTLKKALDSKGILNPGKFLD